MYPVSEIISRYERNFSFPLNLGHLARTITRLDSIYETPFNWASINVLESLNRIVESCTEF